MAEFKINSKNKLELFDLEKKEEIKKTKSDYSKEYENIKSIYSDYIDRINETAVSDSFGRYRIEYNMLNSMQELAEKSELTDEMTFIEERQNEVNEKLKEYGIIPNSKE